MDIAALRQAHPEHWSLATSLRVLAMDAVQAAKSGHPGMPMGMADVATVLFQNHLKFDAKSPDWFDRDRFILSAGHGSMLLYGLLHLTGYEDMTIDEIRNFRQWGSKTAGHPEYGYAKGIDTTTGPLGQGLSTAVGFAMAEEALRQEWSPEICDHRTWVIAGDGCLMEGISHEALGLAGHQALDRLIVLWDNNDITIDGRVSLSDKTDQKARFEAAGWRVLSCNGHDRDEIDAVLTEAKNGDGRPTMVSCKTIIGFGAPNKADSSGAHGSPLGPEEIAATREIYGWSHPAFEIPGEIKSVWEQIGTRAQDDRKAWEARLEARADAAELRRRMANGVSPELTSAIDAMKAEAVAKMPKQATRKSSELVLEAINEKLPEMFGGSADLTGSNNTRTTGLGIFDKDNRGGRYVHYGIREHGMAAAMNGIALHGGLRPYGGTFMTFADYARGAMRISALSHVPVVYVLTHDSIGLGEDGPTHQPVEHLAATRATPNMLVLRPADLVETAEAWQIALEQTRRPSVIALSRQGLPALRSETGKNLSAHGAYILRESSAAPQAILMATGSEVEIAVEAAEALESRGIATRVVSVPSMELFAEQTAEYRNEVLPRGPVRVAIEAAVRLGWDRWLLGQGGDEARAAFIGMEGFGASAPAPELYHHFGITAEAVITKVEALLP